MKEGNYTKKTWNFGNQTSHTHQEDDKQWIGRSLKKSQRLYQAESRNPNEWATQANQSFKKH